MLMAARVVCHDLDSVSVCTGLRPFRWRLCGYGCAARGKGAQTVRRSRIVAERRAAERETRQMGTARAELFGESAASISLSLMYNFDWHY